LFLSLFCFLGLPFTHWWFNGDDFSGLALGKNMQTWKTFWYHFVEGNVSKYFYPSHHPSYLQYGAAPSGNLHFFNIYYRPIQCAYFALTHWLFSFNAYSYYLVSVFIHAINTTLLWNMLTWFTKRVPALFFALLFALHPQIGFRFGAPANFQYYFNVLLLLLTVLALKKFLDSRRYCFLFLSVFCYTIALFTRETAIVFFALLFLGSWLYQKKFSLAPVAHSAAALGYLAIRIYLYPFIFPQVTLGNITSTIPAVYSTICSRFSEILVFIYDTLSLSWLPFGHKLLRLSILTSAALCMIILFLQNRHKLLLTFLAISYVIMLWPSLFGAYSPRYFYEASPLLMVFYATLKGGIQKKLFIFDNSLTKIIITFASTTLICLYAFFTYTNLRCRETKLFTMKQAFITLARDKQITSGTRPLCFLAFPVDGFGTGIEQAAWLFLTPSNNSVYYDPSTMLIQTDSNILEHADWYVRCAPYHTKNYVTIIQVPNGLRFTLTNSQKINFGKLSNYLSLGKKIVHQTTIVNGQKVITDFTLIFEPKYQRQNILIITWDYEK
jgi:hypothetical protein